MTRTTALAALLLLAAFPAAAQSETEASVSSQAVGASPLWAGRVADDDPTIFYSGTMVGRPSLTDIRPSSAGDLPAPGFFVITEPTVVLNHLDFGAYEPYAPARAREALKGIASDARHSVGSGDHDIALTVDGTPAQTAFTTSYAINAAPIDVRAKAGLVVPGLISPSASTAAFVRAGSVLLALSYKF